MHNHLATYRAQGWHTIRIHAGKKTPAAGNAWPDVLHEPHDFQPGDNVGIALGEKSGGIVDIDLDCYEAVALAPYFLAPTATFGRSSKPKSHYIYRCQGIKTRRPPGTHVELRGTKLQTVFPPSIHETGEPIEWTDGTPILDIEETELLPRFGRLVAATVIARAFAGAEGDRHSLALAFAGALWHSKWALEAAKDLLLPALSLVPGNNTDHRETAIDDTWADEDKNRFGWPAVEDTIGPVKTKAIQRALQLVATPAHRAPTADGSPLTDAGNAERFIEEHGDNFRYGQGLGWLAWRETHWVPTSEPVKQAIDTVRNIREDADSEAEGKWAHQSESSGKLTAMISIASALPDLRCTADELDGNAWLVATPNGMVDLRTGALEAADREALITRCVNVPYDPEAKCPRFDQFLSEVFCGRSDLAMYVMRYLGYGLTGETTEQVFQVWHGNGSNGKSTLLNVLSDVLGDYAQTIPANLLMESRFGDKDGNGPTPALARMRGTRLAIGAETKPGQAWNESLVKQLTGGDYIVARHLHKEPFEFQSTAKLVLAVNHKPRVRGTDFGMWRRVHLVPFSASFKGDRVDKSLPVKLEEERVGIFAALVRACLEWQQRGLDVPDTIREEVEAYRKEQDVIGAFLEECCTVGSDKSIERSRLYKAYSHWATEGREYVIGKQQFNKDLRERGYQEVRRRGPYVWAGLDVRGSGLG